MLKESLRSTVVSEKITIYDIAKEAQVSIATVSRILTGSAPVNADTKQRVESVMQKYNFRPNKLARNLSNQRSMMIGVILPDITNPFFSTVFAEIQRYAMAQDYSLLLFNAMNNIQLESEGLAYLSRHQVDGLIFMGGRADEISLPDHYQQELLGFAAQVPTVIVNGGLQSDLISAVCTNEKDGITQVVEYLADLGHQHIGILGGSAHISVTRNRQEALREALQHLGLPVREDWFINEGFSIESGVKALELMLELSEQPSAVIAINDLVALGILKAARQHHIDVPRQLSLVGFDNVYLAEVSTPELTTVSHDYAALGQTIVDTIIQRMNGEAVSEVITIPMQLVVRNSASNSPSLE
jgi:LacI family transcriptional regulator